jgi:hypothetical protein
MAIYDHPRFSVSRREAGMKAGSPDLAKAISEGVAAIKERKSKPRRKRAGVGGNIEGGD